MGSLTRRLKKHTTGLSREAADRVVRNLSRHLEQQPLNDAQQAALKDTLQSMPQVDRVQHIASRLSPEEIKRRLAMPHDEQIALYGFALRGGVSSSGANDSEVLT